MNEKFYLKIPAKSGFLTIILLFCFCFSNAQLVWKNSIVGTSASANGRAPQASHKYTRTLYLVTATELASGGIDAGKVLKAIGFNYRAAEAIPGSTANGTLKIYLQNTTDVSYSKGTSWATAIATMTKVSDAAATIPGATTADFTFANGNTFTYTGDGIYVAFEWLNLTGPLGTANSAYCMNSTTPTGNSNGLYSTYSASSEVVTDAMTINSAFRPATRFAYQVLNNDAKVSKIYAMATAPVNEGKQVIVTRVTNEGATPLTNISATLAVTGANTFTSTKTVSLPVETALATGDGINISFDEFVPTVAGTNNITVTLNSADDNLTNNTETFTQEVISGLFSYNIGNSSNTTGVGSISNANYMAVVKYAANGTVYPKGVRFFLGTNTASVGQNLQAVWYNSDKVKLGESALHTVTAGELGTSVILNFNASNVAVPTIGTSTDFYVGIGAVAATLPIYFIGRQDESPIRPDTFFSGDISTGIFSSSTSKFMIEAFTTTSTLPVTVSSFTANASNNKVALKWEVGTETNVNRYEIERSEKGGVFTKVAAVNATAASSYSAVDHSPLAGNNYYRLKTVDNDGSFSYYGEVRLVKIATLAASSFAIYPTPMVSDEINIALASYARGAYSYQVVDMVGSVVQKGAINHIVGENHTINLKSSITKGIYIFSLTNGKEVLQSKLIKN